MVKTNSKDTIEYALPYKNTPLFEVAYDFYLRTAPRTIAPPMYDLTKDVMFKSLVNGNGAIGTFMKVGITDENLKNLFIPK